MLYYFCHYLTRWQLNDKCIFKSCNDDNSNDRLIKKIAAWKTIHHWIFSGLKQGNTSQYQCCCCTKNLTKKNSWNWFHGKLQKKIPYVYFKNFFLWNFKKKFLFADMLHWCCKATVVCQQQIVAERGNAICDTTLNRNQGYGQTHLKSFKKFLRRWARG